MIYLLICNVVYSILLFLALIKGIEIGIRINKEEKPIKSVKEYIEDKKEEKKIKEEQERVDEERKKLKIVMENIENYDGTRNGQKDVI